MLVGFTDRSAHRQVPERVLGVIGYPVSHSLSPAMHNAAFEAVGLPWVYAAFEVPVGKAEEAVGAMRVLGLEGLSVTVPHKQAVVAAIDSLSDTASVTGAVNTVFWDSRRESLVGDNTDVYGFREGLRTSLGIDLEGRRVLVLGAGGAARAVVWAAVKAGAASVTVAARRPSQAASLVSRLTDSIPPGAGAPRLSAVSATQGALGEVAADSDLLVNTTPVGSDGEGMPIQVEAIHRGLFVYDLIYYPPRTPLVEVGARKGAGAAGGLEMLVHQGALQFRIWTGLEAPVEVMREAAHVAIGARTGRTRGTPSP